MGKRVIILGSGDIGLIMARRMTLEGAKVLACVELMPYSNGLNRNIVQCLKDYNIPLYLSHTITDIQGNGRVEKVIVSKVDENRNPIPGTEITFDCDTILLSVGLIPENELSKSADLTMKTKNKKLKRLTRDSLPVGILGIGEPMMYAVTLPLGKPFVTACLGAGVGGILASLFHLGAVSQGVSGLFGLLIVVPGTQLFYAIAMIGAYIGGFILTYFFGVDEDRINEVYGKNEK